MRSKNSYALAIAVKLIYLGLWVAVIALFLYLPLIGLFGAGQRTLNIFSWGNSFDPDFFVDFEKETGIKLHFSHYQTNEELLVKLEALDGQGYDLIVPSDYAVKQLIDKNLLQPLDQDKIQPFRNLVNPALLGHYFDPDNSYTLPLEWGVFGIGIDKDAFEQQPPKSWDIIFDQAFLEKHHPISMVDDPKEGVMIAALYLFGQAQVLTDSQIEQVKRLLLMQKPYVQMYTDERTDYLLTTKNVVASVSTSAYIWQAMKTAKNIDFFVPKEGSFLTIEHIAIPRGSTKTDLVYKFLKYVYTKEAARHNFLEHALFPAITDALDEVELDPEVRDLVNINREKIKKMNFLTTRITRSQINDIWIFLKSA